VRASSKRAREKVLLAWHCWRPVIDFCQKVSNVFVDLQCINGTTHQEELNGKYCEEK